VSDARAWHLRDESRFGSWLNAIGLNVCRGLLTGGRRLVSLDTLRECAAAVDPAGDEPGPVELITAAELATRVRQAISALPAGQREAVAMFYLRGLTQAEIAEELATRPGPVKTRLHKAHRSPRASLHDTYRDYIDVTDQTPQLIPMRLAELRRAHTQEPGIQRHIMFLEDDQGRRLPIRIGQAEATAMALILEQVDLPDRACTSSLPRCWPPRAPA
jgi:RNA polymerase sigma factor (sigma-70 family)